MATSSLQLLAPAKLNLFLHITGRRLDGYHELQTVFQLLDYGDTMSFTLSTDNTLSLQVQTPSLHQLTNDLDEPLPLESNLIIRAAHLLRDQAQGSLPGVRITLTKRIPAGAGLGGGSANAAITLIALNELWGLALARSELARLGAGLGADVPVFIEGKSAWAEGIGDRLTPIELPAAWYLVITPPCVVSTADVFCHEDLTRNTSAIKMADFLAGRVRNDCEAVTRKLFPEVAAALDWLQNFAEARMTGTGASVFAAFADENEAQKVLKKMPAEWHGFVARGVNSLAHSTDGN